VSHKPETFKDWYLLPVQLDQRGTDIVDRLRTAWEAGRASRDEEEVRSVKVHVGDSCLTRDLVWCECGRGISRNGFWKYCPKCGSQIDQESYWSASAQATANAATTYMSPGQQLEMELAREQPIVAERRTVSEFCECTGQRTFSLPPDSRCFNCLKPGRPIEVIFPPGTCFECQDTGFSVPSNLPCGFCRSGAIAEARIKEAELNVKVTDAHERAERAIEVSLRSESERDALREQVKELEEHIGDPESHFEMLWSSYVIEDDEKLQGDAIDRKRRLLAITGVDTLREQVKALREALVKIWKHTPQIDSGYCAVCRVGYRVFKQKGREMVPQPCSDERCLSHVVIAALALTEGTPQPEADAEGNNHG